ncbi:MAG: hypothetical protein ACO1N0_04420 [Fluviicola sp.]
MQLKTLWLIIIKVFGVYLAYASIVFFVFSLATLSTEKIGPASLVVFILQAVFAYLFLFRTELVVQRFGLEKSITEKRIDANIQSSKILQIAIVVIGINSLIDSVPEMIGNLQVITSKLTGLSVLKVIIGFVLVIKSVQIEKWIASFRRSE